MIRAVMFDGSRRALEREALSGNSGVRSSKRGRSRRLLGVLAVDLVDPQQRRVLLVAERRAAGALEVVALAQPELAGLLHRHVHVVARRQEAADAQEAVALVAQVEVALDVDRLAGELLGRAALGLAAGRPRGPGCGRGAGGGGCRPRRRPGRRPGSAAPPPWPLASLLAVAATAARPRPRRVPRRRPRRRRRRWSLRPPPPPTRPAAPRRPGALRARLARRRGRRGRRRGSGAGSAAGPSPPTPASSSTRSTMSAFLARAGGLPPRALAMVTSSSRSLRSRAERSRAVESTLIDVRTSRCGVKRRGGRESGFASASGRVSTLDRVPCGTVATVARGPSRAETRQVLSPAAARLPPGGERPRSPRPGEGLRRRSAPSTASTSPSARASGWPSSAPTAPARPPRC